MKYKICENYCVHAWNQSENIRVSISIIIMKKIAKNYYSFSLWVINSFPYAMAQLIFYGAALTKSMSQNI